MLVASLNGRSIDAWDAAKGPQYHCPNCRAEVILKQGRIVIHHFAHKPPTDCSWASGETRQHLLAKAIIRDAYRQRGYQAEYEVEVLSGAGDRRADVLLTNAKGAKVAVEIQHTPILYDAIERRTRAYIAAGIPVIWVGILTGSKKADATQTKDGLEIEQYVIRPWEKWAHAYYFKELWYVDPQERSLWKGHFSDYLIDVEETSWYNEYGEEQYAGGYSKVSKKWKTLTLTGPVPLSGARICFESRRTEWEGKTFTLPAGRMAHFK